MGGGGGPDVPRPSREERDLIRTRTDLLRQAQGLTEANLRRRDLLDPLLFEEFGIRPVFAEDGLTLGDGMTTTQPVNMAEGVFARGGMAPGAMTPFDVSSLDNQQRVLEAAADAGLQRQSLFGPLEFVQQGGGGDVLVPVNTESGLQFVLPAALQQGGVVPSVPSQVEGPGVTIGDIIGFERMPDTPEELLRQDIERGLLERTQAAVQGDLPVDPALERSLAEREAQLRTQLIRQFGPGFATSSPGMEALSRLRRDAEGLRGSARRADLATAAGLAEGFGTGRERSRALNVAGIMDILNRQAGGASTLGQVAQSFSVPIGQLANQRNLEFQGNVAQSQAAAQSSQGIGQLLGLLGGAGLGFFAGGPAGALTGASVLGGAGGLVPSLVRR